MPPAIPRQARELATRADRRLTSRSLQIISHPRRGTFGMSSPGSQSAEALAKKPFQLPTIGGKYFALAVLFTMNLAELRGPLCVLRGGNADQKDLQIRRRLVRCAWWLVHDRLHDHLAADGLAGRSVTTESCCWPAAWDCGAWRRSARPFRAILATCFSGGRFWGWERPVTA